MSIRHGEGRQRRKRSCRIETLPAFVSGRDFSPAAQTPTKTRTLAPATETTAKKKSDPLGRGQCAGEPVLRRWSSPRFIRHSGLADTAHRTDCRVEPLFNECRF